MEDNKKEIPYQVLTWGPCVAKMKITEDFYKVLLEECEASQTEDLLYQHRLAGIIQKEYKLRNLEKVQPFISDIVRIYDSIWDKWRNSDTKSVNRYLIKAVWVNYQRKNEFNPPHDHSDELSFVTYLKVPQEIKKEFDDYKGKSSGPGGISFLYGEGNRQAITYQSHFPEVRDLFVFPAWLKHYVAPFKSDVERVSVSGNVAAMFPISELSPQEKDIKEKRNEELFNNKGGFFKIDKK